MAITVPPVDTPKEQVVPASGNSQQDLSATQGKRYLTIVLEDVIKPSIRTFLGICHRNPRVVTLVATTLLASLLVVTLFVLSIFVLVLWPFLPIIIGVFFVIVSGLLSLFFKSLMVLLATVMAGIATTLYVGTSIASHFIIKKASQLVLLVVREVLVAVGHGLHAALKTLFVLQEEEITTSTGPVPQEGSPADPNKVDDKYESPVSIHRKPDAGAERRII